MQVEGTPEGERRAAQEEWDQRYLAEEHLWSGNPNSQLIQETRGLRLGRVLDVGCGEGDDAVWLAEQGWHVTALDVSRVALDRAAAHATNARVEVSWVHAGLVEATLPPASFDLVSAQYPALRRTENHQAEHALIDAVKPGGVLLVVHHAHAGAHGFDLDDYLSPSDIATLLGSEWHIKVNEIRPRHLRSGAGAGAGHTEDIVLSAQRKP